MSKYKWYRRFIGGYWVYFKSSATGVQWCKVSERSYKYFTYEESLPSENYT